MHFKKTFFIVAALVALFFGTFIYSEAATCTGSFFGGTGICYPTVPIKGDVLVGDGVSAWVQTATSSLGISSGGTQNLGSVLTNGNDAGGLNLNDVGNITGTTITATSTATSSIANLNTVLWVPINFATAGCAGNPLYTDFGLCYNGLVTLAHSWGYQAAQVMVPDIKVTGAQWTTAVNPNISGMMYSLDCVRGAVLIYGGTGTSTIFNMSNPTGHLASDDYGCQYQGNSTLIAAGQSNSKTTTGIGFGGSFGAPGVNFHDNTVNGFGRDIEISQNAYMDTIQDNSISGGNGGLKGDLFLQDVSNNSGEMTALLNDKWTDPGNSVVGNDIYFSNGGVASAYISGGSLDDAQIYFGSSDGLISVDHLHVENSAHGTYGAYIPFLGVSSQASEISLTNIEIANDGNADGFVTIVHHGQNLYADAIHIDNYGGGTVTNFSLHDLNNGSESEVICQIQTSNGSGLTNIVGGSGAQAYSQAAGATCTSDVANSYTVSMFNNQNNIADIRNGGQNVATFDQNANWSLGTGSSNSTVTVNNNLKVTGLATPAGTFLAADPNGVIIATSSPPGGSVTSVGLSSTNSTLTVGSSPITTSGTITADLNLAHSNWWTAIQNFTNASTSQLTATSSVWFTSLATPAGTFLAADPNGKIIATTTPSGAVSSVTGTTNQITSSPTTGAVVLSLPNLVVFPGNIEAFASSTIGSATQATGLVVNGGSTTTLNALFAQNMSIGTTSAGAYPTTQGVLTFNSDTNVNDEFLLTNRPNIGIPVPYVSPTANNQNIAFDIMPHGTTVTNGFGNSIYGAAWEDICSNDVQASTSYECLHLGASSYGFDNISTEAVGNGVVRNLAFQMNGGNVGIATSTPWAALSLGSGSLVIPEASSTGTGYNTIDFKNQITSKIEMNANTTINLADDSLAGDTQKVILCQDGTGSRTVTWLSSSTLIWVGHTTPTITATANECDIFSFIVTGATGTPEVFGAATQGF